MEGALVKKPYKADKSVRVTHGGYFTSLVFLLAFMGAFPSAVKGEATGDAARGVFKDANKAACR